MRWHIAILAGVAILMASITSAADAAQANGTAAPPPPATVTASPEPGYAPPDAGSDALSSTPWASTFDYHGHLFSRVFYTRSSKLCVHLKTWARGVSHSNPGHYLQPMHWHPLLDYGDAISPDVFYPATGNGEWWGYCWTGIKTSWQLRLHFNDIKWATSVHGNVLANNS
jgi:hypothetical protein